MGYSAKTLHARNSRAVNVLYDALDENETEILLKRINDAIYILNGQEDRDFMRSRGICPVSLRKKREIIIPDRIKCLSCGKLHVPRLKIKDIWILKCVCGNILVGDYELRHAEMVKTGEKG